MELMVSLELEDDDTQGPPLSAPYQEHDLPDPDALAALEHAGWYSAGMNVVASFRVVFRLLCTWETALVAGFGAAVLVGLYAISEHVEGFNESAAEATISFAWVAFVLTFPLSLGISSAFSRREVALTALAQTQNALGSLAWGACTWNMPPSASPGNEHVSDAANGQRVVALALDCLKPMEGYLLAPTVSRARHFQIRAFKADRRRTLQYQRTCEQLLVSRLHLVEMAIEDLRHPPRQMPPQAVSRLFQYLQFLRTSWQQLRYIKDYRQPLGLRTFNRLVILLLPCIYGLQLFYLSTAAYVLGLFLALSTQTLFVGLYAVQEMLEDPFSEHATWGGFFKGEVIQKARPSRKRLDAIRVHLEFTDLRKKIHGMAKQASC